MSVYSSQARKASPSIISREISFGKTSKSGTRVVYLHEHVQYEESSEDDNVLQWSATRLIEPKIHDNMQAETLKTCSESDICAKYIPMLDALLDDEYLQHVYYEYKAVEDPGIREALLQPEPIPYFETDGIKLYKTVCDKMDIGPIGIVLRNLKRNEINLYHYGVSSKDVRAICMALVHNMTVAGLKLKENFLDDDACFHLGHLFKNNRFIDELDLEGCRICLSGLRRLIAHLRFQRVLTSLNLARNCLSDEGGQYLFHMMVRGISFEKLNLSCNDLGNKTAEEVIHFFEYRHFLSHLDLSHNNFVHIPTLTKMLDRMVNCDNLQDLNLSWNNLHGIKVADALLNILVFVKSLVVLNVRNNRLDGDAVSRIVQGLNKAKNLKTLDLSSNPLSPEDAITVINTMLYSEAKLSQLWLENICITKEFLEILERVQNIEIKYGDLIRNWVVKEPDLRNIILRRMEFLSERELSDYKIDVGVYFLRLSEEYLRPVPIKDFIERIVKDNIPVDKELLNELADVFPGPKVKGSESVDLKLIKDYIYQIWPKKSSESELNPRPDRQKISEEENKDHEKQANVLRRKS